MTQGLTTIAQQLFDVEAWATALFGSFRMGDKRFERRMVQWAIEQAQSPETGVFSLADSAFRQGLDTLLRSPSLQPEAMLEAQREYAFKLAQMLEDRLLLISDSTTEEFPLALSSQGGILGSEKNSTHRGVWTHSELLATASGIPLGIIAQQRWKRTDADFGKRVLKKRRAYEDKEGFKWEGGLTTVLQHTPASILERLWYVADAEADLFAMLGFLSEHLPRFTIRVGQRHRALVKGGSLEEEMANSEMLGHCQVEISGSKGQPARTAFLSVRAQPVLLQAPERQRGQGADGIGVWCVWVREELAPEGVDPLDWMLLTTHDCTELEGVWAALSDYRCRWLIERVHEALKDKGCRSERRGHRNEERLLKVWMMLWAVAVRLVQMEHLTKLSGEESCETFCAPEAWKILWLSVEEKKPLPSVPPSILWLWRAIARLSGWADSNRSGRPGWKHIWKGLLRWNDRMYGYYLAQSHSLGSSPRPASGTPGSLRRPGTHPNTCD